MGYQKIQARRKELESQQQSYQQFVKVANAFNSRLSDIEKAFDALKKQKDETAKSIAALNTNGVKVFAEFQKSLLEECKTLEPKPVSVNAIQKFMQDSQRAIDNEMDAYIDKLTGSFPAKVAAGMTFKQASTKRVYEILSGPVKATNENLQGDAALWYKVKFWQDGAERGTLEMSLADISPKKGFKFLKV